MTETLDVNAAQYDGFLPAHYDPTDWHNAVLGSSIFDDDLRIDLRTDPNIVIVGGPGTGKSILVQRLAVSALSRGHQVVMINPKSVEFGWMEDRFTRTVSTHEEAIRALTDVVDLAARRAELLDHAVRGWTEVPGLMPVTVVVDSLISNDLIGASVQYYLGQLARTGRTVGIHLVIVEQALHFIPGKLRDDLTTRVLLITPKVNLEQLTLFMSGSGSRGSDALKLIESVPLRAARGLALVSRSNHDLAIGQVAPISFGEVVDAFETLGVPKPTQLGGEIA